MIRFITTIDSLRGIVEHPNDTIKAYQNKKIQSIKGLFVTEYSDFNDLIDEADILYITQVNGSLRCTKFFPAFENKFTLVKRSAIHKENGTEFQYQIWRNNKLLSTAELN